MLAYIRHWSDATAVGLSRRWPMNEDKRLKRVECGVDIGWASSSRRRMLMWNEEVAREGTKAHGLLSHERGVRKLQRIRVRL